MGIAEVSAYILAGVLVLVLCRIFFRPLKTVLWLGFNSLLGGLGLYIFNWIFAPTGFFIGINIATATIAGLLGLPGVLLLILVKWIVGM
ncbi:MAG: pro-sigmaK processing inhibitor BofA family protein [Clostridia bacterium]|nr:pro-sigmaK processing inhibitor BofA family protein [Clostridia bacterium]MBQ3554077.1 pro-sigmaK processing inhibitor BofA family protein [Clostridia bacterium]